MFTLDKILVVDDDPEDQAIIHEAFVEIGEETLDHYEENGYLAIQFLEACFLSGSLPPLVILDLNMPKMNGTQTLQAIKSDPRFNKIYVIIYSTSLNPIERNKCLQLGAEEFLIKPTLYTDTIKAAQYFKTTFERLKGSMVSS